MAIMGALIAGIAFLGYKAYQEYQVNKFSNKFKAQCVGVIVLSLVLIGLCSGNTDNTTATETSSTKQEETVKEEKIDKEEVRKNLSMLEALYVNHYNSLSKLDASSKIEMQNQLDSSINTLNNGYDIAYDNMSKLNSDTDAYKAFDNIQFAIFELKEAKEYAIKYLDTENYDDYKEYQTKLQISMDSYIKYTAFKDEFDVNINVSINE